MVKRIGSLFRGTATTVAAVCTLVTGLFSFSALNASGAHADGVWAPPGASFYTKGVNGWFSCSVGVPLTDNAGKHYFLTAGHCFRSSNGRHLVTRSHGGLPVYDSNSRQVVGYELLYLNPHRHFLDISLVYMPPGARFQAGSSAHASGISASSGKGAQACVMGQHSSGECGVVLKKFVNGQVGYPWPALVNEASYCSREGDSGGLIYNSGGVLGIQSSVNTVGGGKSKCSSYYVDIHTALRAFKKHAPGLHVVPF